MIRVWLCEVCHKQFPYDSEAGDIIARTNALACEASHHPVPILYSMAQEVLELRRVQKTCDACGGYGSPCGSCTNGIRPEWHQAQERMVELAWQMALKVREENGRVGAV